MALTHHPHHLAARQPTIPLSWPSGLFVWSLNHLLAASVADYGTTMAAWRGALRTHLQSYMDQGQRTAAASGDGGRARPVDYTTAQVISTPPPPPPPLWVPVRVSLHFAQFLKMITRFARPRLAGAGAAYLPPYPFKCVRRMLSAAAVRSLDSTSVSSSASTASPRRMRLVKAALNPTPPAPNPRACPTHTAPGVRSRSYAGDSG